MMCGACSAPEGILGINGACVKEECFPFDSPGRRAGPQGGPLQGAGCGVGTCAITKRHNAFMEALIMGKHKKVERMKEIDRRRKRREERLKLRIREAKAAAKSK